MIVKVPFVGHSSAYQGTFAFFFSYQYFTIMNSSGGGAIFTVFYDPNLALHTSRGWDVSQLVQGRVATVSGNRFNITLPNTVTNTTAGDLRELICETFNEKIQRAKQETGEEEGPCPLPVITPSTSVLSWGTTVLYPNDRMLSSFGMRDSHSGALLLLETFSGGDGDGTTGELDQIQQGALRDNDRYLQARNGSGSETIELSPSSQSKKSKGEEEKGSGIPSGSITLDEAPIPFRTVDRSLLLAAAERRMRAAKK